MFEISQFQGFNAFTPIPTVIKSIQAVEITIATGATSATATITHVDPAKSALFFGGFTTTNTGNTFREILPRAELTNATTVTVYRNGSSATHTVTVRATVVEFQTWAVTGVQHGTVTIAVSTTSNTATISSVNTAASAVFLLGYTVSNVTTNTQGALSRLDLTNATTVTATRGLANTSAVTVGYCVVEFASGVLASVQQRSVTLATSATSSTDTIASVNTARSLLLWGGATSATAPITSVLYHLTLTNATTVTLGRTGTSTGSRTVNYTVLEFASGVVKALQRGTQAIASAAAADAAISGVNTLLTLAHMPGFSTDAATNDERFASAKLLDATTLRGQKNTAGTTTSTVAYEAVEFY